MSVSSGAHKAGIRPVHVRWISCRRARRSRSNGSIAWPSRAAACLREYVEKPRRRAAACTTPLGCRVLGEVLIHARDKSCYSIRLLPVAVNSRRLFCVFGAHFACIFFFLPTYVSSFLFSSSTKASVSCC